MNGISNIRLQVMWNRLLAVVEEQAQALVRTAFSTAAREAGDISAGVFDPEGRMLAQAVTGTPGHVNAMALSIRHFLDRFPAAEMQEGDCFVTNDPWKGTGHLHDFTVVSPAFFRGKLIGLFGCTTHVVDIGGRGLSPESNQVFEEGLRIPLMRLASRGDFDESILMILRENVREPVQVEGDIYALAACNETGIRRLTTMMEEYALADLNELGNFILESSSAAMKRALAAWPQGTARYSMTIDGYDAPIELVAELTIGDGEVFVDYAGTSPRSNFGINCPKCYTDAYTAFGVKCIIAPRLPNNDATIAMVKISAPKGSIVNPLPPAAVVARVVVGQMLPDVVFGCLEQLRPGQVPAEGTSTLWSLKLGAGHGIAGSDKREGMTDFQVICFHSGGAGARPELDGLSATPFPSGVRSVPIEVTESATPLVFWRKELREESGGPGRRRGGLGQTIVVGSREAAPFAVYATFERTRFAPRGRSGGEAGALGTVFLDDGTKLNSKGRQAIPAGRALVVNMPGGGGYGSPVEREPQLVLADVRAGYVSRAAALQHYKVVINDHFEIDEAGTHQQRGITPQNVSSSHLAGFV